MGMPTGLLSFMTWIHDVSALMMLVLFFFHVLLAAVVPWSWPCSAPCSTAGYREILPKATIPSGMNSSAILTGKTPPKKERPCGKQEKPPYWPGLLPFVSPPCRFLLMPIIKATMPQEAGVCSRARSRLLPAVFSFSPNYSRYYADKLVDHNGNEINLSGKEHDITVNSVGLFGWWVSNYSILGANWGMAATVFASDNSLEYADFRL